MKEDTFNYLRDRYGSDEYYEYISSNVKVLLKLEKDSAISKKRLYLYKKQI